MLIMNKTVNQPMPGLKQATMQKFLLGPVKHLPNPGGHVGLQTAVFLKKKSKIQNSKRNNVVVNYKQERRI